MSSENPVLGYEEPDRHAEPVNVTQQVADRRRLFRKLVALAGLGITGVLLSQDERDFLVPVHAGSSMLIDANGGSANMGTSTTELDSSIATGNAFFVHSTGTTGSTVGVVGQSDSPSGIGVYGLAPTNTGATLGVSGQSNSPSGTGVYGYASAGTGTATGVTGQTKSTGGTGVEGFASATTGGAIGVVGQSDSTGGTGVEGFASATSGPTNGVLGNSNSTSGIGVYGYTQAKTGYTLGVYGLSDSNGGIGVYGHASAGTGYTLGVQGLCDSSGGIGVLGWAGNDGARPLAARAHSSTQSAALQEWQNPIGNPLSVVDPKGHFGIGTATPTALLHLFSASAWPGFTMQGGTASSGVNGYQLINDNSYQFNIGVGGSANTVVPSTFFIYDNNKGSFRFVINPSGNVGIGTQTPTHLLQLGGGAYCDGSGAWIAGSSVRWKENIEPLTGGVETLRKLHPVSYNRKETPGKTTMGFIAEEVGKVLPTVVDWDPKDVGYAEGYDHLAILALSVQALKELVTRSTEQQTRIGQLETQNSEQQSTIQQLKEEFKKENEKLQERIAVLQRKQFTVS